MRREHCSSLVVAKAAPYSLNSFVVRPYRSKYETRTMHATLLQIQGGRDVSGGSKICNICLILESNSAFESSCKV